MDPKVSALTKGKRTFSGAFLGLIFGGGHQFAGARLSRRRGRGAGDPSLLHPLSHRRKRPMVDALEQLSSPPEDCLPLGPRLLLAFVHVTKLFRSLGGSWVATRCGD